jgi:hypothetical protein
MTQWQVEFLIRRVMTAYLQEANRELGSQPPIVTFTVRS